MEDSAHSRMATLLLLAKGRAPSWRQQKALQHQRQSNKQKADEQRMLRSGSAESKQQAKLLLSWRVLLLLWIIGTCCKILLVPAYHSTDLLVHRHWKAVALHLPRSQWYHDDHHVQTIHTVDYPPGFMLMEYVAANVMRPFLEGVDTTCLALRTDADTTREPVSRICIAAMRTSVICADAMLWLGAYAITSSSMELSSSLSILLFGLLVAHPALLWLDHVHFQYNGALLGVLLLSLSCLLQVNRLATTSKVASGRQGQVVRGEHVYHMAAAALYCVLVALKHIYVTNLAWFAVYLGRRYCCYWNTTAQSRTNNLRLSVKRVLILVMVGGAVLAAPLLVFAQALWRESKDAQDLQLSVKAWCRQVLSRMFPFGRGLVHDYWAGNVWAIYTAGIKATRVLARRFQVQEFHDVERMIQSVRITPAVTAVCMLVAQTPGLRLAWHAAATRSNAHLLQSFTLCSLANFMFQFHAHEKAVLTAVIPGTIWAVSVLASTAPCGRQKVQSCYLVAALAWDMNAVALLGLFPLLFQPQELLLKVFSLAAYLSVLRHVLAPSPADDPSSFGQTRQQQRRRWYILTFVIAATIVQLDTVPVSVFGRYEFLPLAITSLVCAVWFLLQFLELRSLTRAALTSSRSTAIFC